LVGQHQDNEEQHRGHGADQKAPDLLNDFLHGGTGSLRRSGLTFREWNTFLYQGRSHMVNVVGADLAGSCDSNHECEIFFEK
jgi:hypothetical protein